MSISADTASPFDVDADAAAALENDSVFQRVRQCMNSSFCSFHGTECSEQQRSVFQLHRDIIYTLLLPLYEIHDQATQIATRVLGRRKGAEPERAFRGQARGAFAWLHCILTEERDFCQAEGCPACVVLHVLSSEPTIRLVAVACMLGDFLPATDLVDVKKRHFGFWLKAMEKAVREDALWGEEFWPEIQHRAESLAVDIRYLIMQCVEHRSGTEVQRTASNNHHNHHNHHSHHTNHTNHNNNHNNKSAGSIAMRPDRHAYRVHVRNMPIQPSALARRQLNMMWEEQDLVSKYLQSCWNTLCWSDRRQKMVDFAKAGALYFPTEGTI